MSSRRRRVASILGESLERRTLLAITATPADQAAAFVDPSLFTITATDPSASEANPADTATFTVTRNGDTTFAGSLWMDVSVGAGSATQNADYSIPESYATRYNNSLIVGFAAGQPSTTFTIVPRKDNLVEGSESVTYALRYYDGRVEGTSASGTATATIADDPPRFAIAASDPAAKEGGADTAAFVLTRTGGSTDAFLYLSFTTNVVGPGLAALGADYALSGPGLSGTTVTFGAGETSKTITLTALPDNLIEGPETATLTLAGFSSSTGSGTPTGTATATLADDPPRFTITATDSTAKEADATDTATFTVTRAGGDLSTSLQVNLAASAGGVGLATPPGQPGADYSLSSYDYDTGTDSIIFSPGAPSRTITLTAINDSLAEGTETATLSLTGYYSPAGLVPVAGSAVAMIFDGPVGNIAMGSITYATTLNPSRVKFFYSVNGNIPSFTVSLYYSADQTWDASDRIYMTQVVAVDAGANPRTGYFQTAGPLSGDATRPYLLVVADPSKAIVETNESDNVSNAILLPTVTVTSDKAGYTLMDTALIQASVSAAGAGLVVIEASENAGTWVTLATATSTTLVQRIAGPISLHAYVIVGSIRFDSTVKVVTVQFPDFATIVAQTPVASAADAAWQETQNFAHANAGSADSSGNYPDSLVREQGFWIYLDTVGAGQYSVGATIYGDPTKIGLGISPASVDTGPRPSDQFANASTNAPLGSAIYPVAALHTHPPFTYTLGLTRPTGPSGNDANYYSHPTVDVPGLVYDYNTSNLYSGHGLNDPAHIYQSGPNRRTTPQ